MNHLHGVHNYRISILLLLLRLPMIGFSLTIIQIYVQIDLFHCVVSLNTPTHYHVIMRPQTSKEFTGQGFEQVVYEEQYYSIYIYRLTCTYICKHSLHHTQFIVLPKNLVQADYIVSENDLCCQPALILSILTWFCMMQEQMYIWSQGPQSVPVSRVYKKPQCSAQI